MINITKRKRARFLAVQALYQWQISKEAIANIEAQFVLSQDQDRADLDYFKVLLRGVTMHRNIIDPLLEQFSERNAHQMNPVDLQILRQAAYEINYLPEIPYKVTINEAVDLAKIFGSAESKSYINGILHALATSFQTNA